MPDPTLASPPGPSTPLSVRLVAVPVVVVGLLAGLWITGGLLAPTYWTSIGFGAGWFVLASVGLGKLTKTRPQLRRPVRGAFLATAAVVGGVFVVTSVRDDRVDERVVTGVPASRVAAAAKEPARAPAATNVERARGEFASLAHGAQGTARVVELPGGARRLTFTGFDVSAGPDLRVYLVAGDVQGDGDVRDFRDLGDLKGNVGNQQYVLPRDLDTERYATVVIWCRAFTVGFAKARLAPS